MLSYLPGARWFYSWRAAVLLVLIIGCERSGRTGCSIKQLMHPMHPLQTKSLICINNYDETLNKMYILIILVVLGWVLLSKFDGFVKSLKTSFRSFPRRRESSIFKWFWMPAFAGMTEFRTFYGFVNFQYSMVRVPRVYSKSDRLVQML